MSPKLEWALRICLCSLLPNFLAQAGTISFAPVRVEREERQNFCPVEAPLHACAVEGLTTVAFL